ncbi:RE1-silencing transcription factor [Choloepus didactylus]|uniref:RE1-silencing transcription factor n=1 Tax=Choloepus didactylus TaxID=27675 RepID=UPI00189E543C|nr:RE1-silencing transcription factor [Choloepus didactylus]XP_037685804.1 RE1-silencing transcription factor [Choloepus didactylus]
MATQVMGQSSGGGGLFTGSANIGMALPNDVYDLHDLSKAELAAPQLIMLANVALTGEVNGNCCDYLVGEERQMAELMPVGDNNFSDSDGEGLEESPEIKGEPNGMENMELGSLELSVVEPQPVFEVSAAPEIYNSNKDLPTETPGAEDKSKNLKTKPFRCKPCQYEAESEEQFVHHIRVHSAKKFFVEESAEKQAKARESGSSTAEEGDFSKGPIRCDRCGYNTNRYDHYTAHLKHHTRAGDNERVYKCIICTYTTVSEYHWRKHLRNHFPRKVYTCGKCNYFSDRKNNYVQHVRTHTGERPYKCELCPYSSSQKTHLTRHMRTHSGEKPFKCDQCSYVASNQHEVTRHARQVHNGPKPLNCPHCDYKTADRSNFKKHVELHVNPRQFNCPVCDYAASKKCNLQYHFKSKHPTCPNKTMDVSKVKLKKTKKREADLPDNITNDKTETQQTKIKGDTAGKKNEKPVKVEKKDNVSKEKKPCSNASVVSTRTRKSAAEPKEMDVHPGNKSCKTKKSKRKMETDAHSFNDPVHNEEPVTKKKKKVESRSKNCQELPKGDGKVEENKKQNTCMKRSTKKKTLKNKSSKKSSKPPQIVPAQKGPVQKGPVQVELLHLESAQKGPVPMESPPVRSAQMEPTPREPVKKGPTLMDSAQVEPPPREPVKKGSAQMDPLPVESAQMEPPPREPVKKGSAPMDPLPMESAQMEPPPREPVKKGSALVDPLAMESAQLGPAQVEPPPVESSQIGSAPVEPPPVESAHLGPAHLEPPPMESVPPQMEPIPRRSPRPKDNKMEKSGKQSEMARKEQVLIEVGLVPVNKDRQVLTESTCAQDLLPSSPPLPKENLKEKESKDQKLCSEGEGIKEVLQKAEVADNSIADLDASTEEPTSISSSEQNLKNMPEHEILDGKHRADTMPGEMKTDTDQNTTENLAGEDSAVEEPISPLLLPPVEGEAVSKTTLASPSVTTAANEPQEIDEDEGIHSHDGSDLSDNMSEGSDDSGLNGARPVPQEASRKNAKEASGVKVAEGDFVCIFCDRSFRKEKDYSKHLNRHLVNVYFLEKAAKGQE